MNIIDANQQFTVHEHRVFTSGRLEHAAGKHTILPPSLALNKPPQTANSQHSVPALQQQLMITPLPEPTANQQIASKDTPSESTISDEQNEDQQRFNALQTVGAVKRILDQLSTGKLLSWIDGSATDKIQAQLTDQAQHSTGATANASSAPTTTVTEWSYRYQQLNANFNGELTMADGSTFSWAFELAMQEQQFSFRTFTAEQLKDPLIVSLGGSAAELKSQGIAFDFFGNGERYRLPDLGTGQYYLMQDLNNNQHLDSGLELFGPRSGQGFRELETLDDNQNGLIEASDSRWQSLHLWSRQHGMQSLQQAGIAAISAQSVATSFGLYDGEALLGRIARSGIFVTEPNLQATRTVGLVQQVDINI